MRKAALGSPMPRVIVLSRHPRAFLRSYPVFNDVHWLKFHKGDICDVSSFPLAEHFTHVLHAASDSSLGPQIPPLDRYNQIVQGSLNLLNLAVERGAKRFLFASSGAIYGPQPQQLTAFPEDWPGSPALNDPVNAYGLAKRAAEHLCSLFFACYGLETVVARCFTFVGPDLPLNVHFAIGNFIRDALISESISIYGDGTPQRTYLDQRDLAQWLITMLECGRPGEAYNVGSNEAITIAELAYLVRDVLAPNKPVRILGKPITGSGRSRYLPDIRKAKEQLGLDVIIPLAEAIRHAGSVQRKFANSQKIC